MELVTEFRVRWEFEVHVLVSVSSYSLGSHHRSVDDFEQPAPRSVLYSLEQHLRVAWKRLDAIDKRAIARRRALGELFSVGRVRQALVARSFGLHMLKSELMDSSLECVNPLTVVVPRDDVLAAVLRPARQRVHPTGAAVACARRGGAPGGHVSA